MTAEQFIKAQVCAFAHREAAHHGGIDNMLAVVFVLRNRQRAGWGDWMDVLNTADKAAATVYAPTPMNLRDINVRMLLGKIDDIYTGMEQDKYTNGAMFYAELNRIENQQFLTSIVRNPESHPRTAVVGNVVFFK